MIISTENINGQLCIILNDNEIIELSKAFRDGLLTEQLFVEIVADYFGKIEKKIEILNSYNGDIRLSINDIDNRIRNNNKGLDIQFAGIFDNLMEIEKKVNTNMISITKLERSTNEKLNEIQSNLNDMNKNNNIFWRALQIITLLTALFGLFAWIVTNY